MTRLPLYSLFMLCMTLCALTAIAPRTASAAIICPYCPVCEIPENAKTRNKVSDEHNQQRIEKFGTSDPLPPQRGKCQQHGTRRLGQDQNWWIDNFLNKGTECGGSGKNGFLLGALQLMTEEMVTLAMTHTLAIGTMFDAWLQLDTQTTFERLQLAARKDYQPSMGMCVAGTTMRSLGAAEHNASVSASAFANRQKDRALGAGSTAAKLGTVTDASYRLCNFKRSYCDINDNNRLTGIAQTGFEIICDRTKPCGENEAGDIGSSSKWAYNRDIDFTRTVMNPNTLGLDLAVKAREGDLFSGNESGGSLLDALNGLDAYKYDRESVFALSSLLYADNVMDRLRKTELEQQTSMDEVIAYRALSAKRSVAQNSFDAIVGMKAMGTGLKRGGGGTTGAGGEKITSEDTARYMAVILEDMGMTREDIARMMGPQFGSGEESVSRPSYFAQLKFMAKMMYQRPGFYVDLYETPTNVERRRVAMQGINSILDREIYNSYLRSEMILSQILELELEEGQSALESHMANPKRGRD